MREFTPEQKRLLEQADPQTRALLEKHGFDAFDGYDSRSGSDTFAPGEDYLKAALSERLQGLAGKLAKMEKKQDIEKLIKERPDLFDDMDCRPGRGNYPEEQGDEIMDSILPDWRERMAAQQAKLAERKKKI